MSFRVACSRRVRKRESLYERLSLSQMNIYIRAHHPRIATAPPRYQRTRRITGHVDAAQCSAILQFYRFAATEFERPVQRRERKGGIGGEKLTSSLLLLAAAATVANVLPWLLHRPTASNFTELFPEHAHGLLIRET